MAELESILAGTKSPHYLRLTLGIDSDDEDAPDLTECTAAVFSVRTPAGPTTWSATIVDATVDTITLKHVFASNGLDVARTGRYRVVAVLTLPEGQRVSTRAEFRVVQAP